jgi:hypothetical protein
MPRIKALINETATQVSKVFSKLHVYVIGTAVLFARAETAVGRCH